MIPDLIYDVGSHVGHDTAFYLHKGFRVLAIDANPAMVATAERRFAAALASGRLTLLNVGISPERAKLDFWISERDSGSSSLDRQHAAGLASSTRRVQVDGLPFAHILRQFGVPYYIKIDIEGADHLCLEALSPADLPQYLSWEAGSDAQECLELAYRLGYRHFKCIDQLLFRQPPYRFGWPFRIRRKLRRMIGAGEPLEIAAAGWRFVRGHSAGPFGEDTDGDWQSIQEMKAEWLALHERCAMLPGWYDFHARLEP